MGVNGELPSVEQATSARVRVRPPGLIGGVAMVVVWVALAALVLAAALLALPFLLVAMMVVASWRGAGRAIRAKWVRSGGRRNVRVREEGS